MQNEPFHSILSSLSTLFPLVNFTLISALSSDRFVSYNFFFLLFFFFSLSFSFFLSLRKRGRITETPRSIEITDNRDPVNQGPAVIHAYIYIVNINL